ncbi:hypothetical protein [Rickettsia argasii]|uniref:Transposase domain protein n=1 Tax=Rickettsia argasii T170-B TaxID=1268837 RepID=A0A0F3RCB5_9RICK|nr:hypothetical protein [Rickettsia argasii]KJW03742.1 transposase domain protein [Rickettsia argasii T170-B]
MPYKERVRAGLPRKRDKQKYKVTNWSQYNQSLRQRGMISLYFPEGDLETLFIRLCSEGYLLGFFGRNYPIFTAVH